MNAGGCHSKTIAYSIWHIFRIEDIVMHTLIGHDEQIFFSGNYQERIGVPIITAGNELVRQQIADFSKQLDQEALYRYFTAVIDRTDEILKDLSYADSKRRMAEKDREHLKIPEHCKPGR